MATEERPRGNRLVCSVEAVLRQCRKEKGVKERAAAIERATGSSQALCWCASVET